MNNSGGKNGRRADVKAAGSPSVSSRLISWLSHDAACFTETEPKKTQYLLPASPS